MPVVPGTVAVVSAAGLFVEGYARVESRERAINEGFEFTLEALPQGISLVHLRSPETPLTLDFVSGRLGFRLAQGRARQEILSKAVLGRHAAHDTRVLDATAGLGRDAAILAAAGCDVTLLERQPLLCALLENALTRASGVAFSQRMHLQQADACHFLSSLPQPAYDVVYLDPMFVDVSGKAAVKKELAWLRRLLPVTGHHEEADMLYQARRGASRRVVVKRAAKAAWLAAEKPTASVGGKAIRFDIYTPL